MSPVRATVLQLSLDLQLRTLQLSRYARSKRRPSGGRLQRRLMEQARALRQLRAAEQLVAADRWHEAAAAYLVTIRSLAAASTAGSGHDDSDAKQRRAARGLSFTLSQLCAEAPIADRLAALSQALAALPPAAGYAQAVLHGDVGAWCCRAAMFPAALLALRKAAALDPTAPGVLENMQHVLSSAVQRWHFRMLNDRRRNEAYGAAIAAVLAEAPDARVLDIGTGTGLLAMLAARAGATEVWACDCVPVMTELARECTAANGFVSEKRVRVVDALSTHLSVRSAEDGQAAAAAEDEGKALPGRADLVVTEILVSNIPLFLHPFYSTFTLFCCSLLCSLQFSGRWAAWRAHSADSAARAGAAAHARGPDDPQRRSGLRGVR